MKALKAKQNIVNTIILGHQLGRHFHLSLSIYKLMINKLKKNNHQLQPTTNNVSEGFKSF